MGSTTDLDMLSPCTSGQKLSTCEKRPKMTPTTLQHRITKIGTYIYTDTLINPNHTRDDVTDFFRLAVIEVQRTVENALYDGFATIYLVDRSRWNHQISKAHPCRHALLFALDMTSLTTSGRKLQRKNKRKCRLQRPWVDFQWRCILPPHQLVGFLFRELL